jgi:hypothetical protein
MIELIKYQPEHYLKVSRREYDQLTFGVMGNPEVVARQLSQGMAFTQISPEGIVACAGVLPIWTGVGEGWAITSDLVCKYPFSFARTVHKKICEIVGIYKLDRLQTLVDAEFTTSIRWLERMGFKFEGEMEKYIAGRTYLRYAWIRRE